jgi:hypothetical protein
MTPLDATTLGEIESLTRDLDPLVTRRPRRPSDDYAEFAERRHALLARHLGFAPTRPVEPLHVIGDSNTMFFAGAEHLRFVRYCRLGVVRPRWINRGLDLLPCFRTYHVGPSTTWKAPEKGSSTRAREKIELLLRRHLPAGARVMLSFGEIDCRMHMPKAALAGRKIASLVSATAEKYIALPRFVRDLGFRTSLWHIPQIIPRDENDPEATLPSIGPIELRNEITYAMIEAQREVARREGFPFVALAGTFHPREERMPQWCFHDGVHLSQVLMPHSLRMLREAGILDLAPSQPAAAG